MVKKSIFFLALLLATGPLKAQDAYFPNFGGQSVSVVTSTDTLKTVLSGAPYNFVAPLFIGVSPITGMIYIGDIASNRIVVIDGDNNFVTSIFTTNQGLSPQSIAISPITGMIYIIDPNASSVFVFDQNNNPVTVLSNGSSGFPANAFVFPTSIAVSPTTGKIYVGNISGNSFAVINSNNTFQTLIASGIAPYVAPFDFLVPTCVAISPLTDLVYLGASASANVVVVNGNNDTPNQVFTGAPFNVNPRAMTVSPVTGEIYIANDNNTITVVDSTNAFKTILQQADYGFDFLSIILNFVIGVSPESGALYVPNGANSTVTIINSDDSLKTILPQSPFQFSEPLAVAFHLGLSGPTSASGRQIENRYLKQTDLVNEITWSAVTGAVSYQIIRNNELIATVASPNTLYRDHNRKQGVTYTYVIKAVNSNGTPGSASPSIVLP